MPVHREVERAYDVAADAPMPALDGIANVASVAAPRTFATEAAGFDTAEGVLAAAGITIRRCTGGDADGWLLTLPEAGGARQVIRLPLGRAARTVPDPLRDAVHAYVRDRRLERIADFRTERTARPLLDTDGRPLAEVRDDRIEEIRAGDEAPPRREWVVVPAGDPPTGALSGPVGRLLESAGGTPAPASGRPDGPRLRREGPASAVVHARLREQVTELRIRDPQARLDLPDAVHRMRVALRRLRSALATFRPLLDREVTDPLRDEMRWLAGALGGTRDTEVIRERLHDRFDAEPAELLPGPVRRRIDADLRDTYRAERETALRALGSERYLRLLDALDELLADPPWRARAGRAAIAVLPSLVRRDWRRLRRRAAAVDAAQSAAERDAALHEVRKAAKRARYAAESVAPVVGRPARHFAAAVAGVQSALGDHQDTVLTRRLLRRLGAASVAGGENGFGYGLLYAGERDCAGRFERAYAEAWRRAARPELRRWL